MKKESAFKMTGFSGFGNESPVKKIVGGGTGPSTHGKSKYKYNDPFYKDRAVRDDRGNTARVQGAGGVASKKHRETYKKVGEAAQAYATRPHGTSKAKADKLMGTFNTQVKKAAKEMKNAQRLNENFRKGMSTQRKRMAIDQPKAKKSGGKIKQTPKPTRTQKIKKFFGL